MVSVWFYRSGLRAEAGFCNGVTGSEPPLQHDRDVVCTGFSNRCLRLAQ